VRLLITGLSGLIGGALHRHLGTKHAIRALNRRPSADAIESAAEQV